MTYLDVTTHLFLYGLFLVNTIYKEEKMVFKLKSVKKRTTFKKTFSYEALSGRRFHERAF